MDVLLILYFINYTTENSCTIFWVEYWNKKKFVVVGKYNDFLFILDFHFFNLLYHKQGKNYSYNKEIF